MVTDAGGTYLMADTDSMAIVSSERVGLIPCNGGPYRLPDGKDAVKALSWEMVRQIVGKFEALNPYDQKVIRSSILNIVEISIPRRQVSNARSTGVGSPPSVTRCTFTTNRTSGS